MEIDHVFLINCLEFMKNCDSGIFDGIITDPPYESGYDRKTQMMDEYDRKNGRKSDRTKAGYSEFKEGIDYNLFAPLFYKVLKDNSWCIIFSADHQSFKWKEAMEKAGFEFRQFRIWKKENVTLSLSPYRTGLSHEMINVFSKGKPRNFEIVRRMNGSVIEIPTIRERYHPTQKPIPLLIQLIEDYTNPNDLIYEPFSGSGSTLIAAKIKGRRAVGNELIKEYADRANKEIQLAQRDLSIQKRLFDNADKN